MVIDDFDFGIVGNVGCEIGVFGFDVIDGECYVFGGEVIVVVEFYVFVKVELLVVGFDDFLVFGEGRFNLKIWVVVG